MIFHKLYKSIAYEVSVVQMRSDNFIDFHGSVEQSVERNGMGRP
jgi:hypothetical protein